MAGKTEEKAEKAEKKINLRKTTVKNLARTGIAAGRVCFNDLTAVGTPCLRGTNIQ